MMHREFVLERFPLAIPIVVFGVNADSDQYAIWSGPHKIEGGRRICAWVSSISSAWEQAYLRLMKVLG